MVETPEVRSVPVGELKIDGRNPNQMSNAKREALKLNIQKYGFIHPIVANKDKVVADGQHRLEAARELGMAEVPVIVLDVSDVDRRMLRQILNKLRGEHDAKLDADEYAAILAADRGADFASLMAMDEKDIGILAGFSEPPMLGKEVSFQATERKCPKCGFEF